jgi:hypothetical protein
MRAEMKTDDLKEVVIKVMCKEMESGGRKRGYAQDLRGVKASALGFIDDKARDILPYKLPL